MGTSGIGVSLGTAVGSPGRTSVGISVAVAVAGGGRMTVAVGDNVIAGEAVALAEGSAVAVAVRLGTGVDVGSRVGVFVSRLTGTGVAISSGSGEATSVSVGARSVGVSVTVIRGASVGSVSSAFDPDQIAGPKICSAAVGRKSGRLSCAPTRKGNTRNRLMLVSPCARVTPTKERVRCTTRLKIKPTRKTKIRSIQDL